MLGKLIKHEFSATGKTYGILCLICVAFTAFACLTTLLVGAIADSNPVLAMLATLPSTLLGSLVISVMSAFPIYHAAWRFYKNLASDEGYLMHMLPVPTWSLVLSKSIVAVIWTFISTALGIVAYIASQMAYSFVMFSEIEEVDLNEVLTAFKELLGMTLDFDVSIAYILITVAIIAILSLIFSVLSLYLCIAIGQLWTAHRILGSIIAYILLSLILNIIVSVAMIVLILIGITSLVAFNIVLAGCALVMAGAVVGCYLATVNIFKKKLNLQ